jgi:hypothetical protein
MRAVRLYGVPGLAQCQVSGMGTMAGPSRVMPQAKDAHKGHERHPHQANACKQFKNHLTIGYKLNGLLDALDSGSVAWKIYRFLRKIPIEGPLG